jgi:hypothetical protein
MWDVLDQNLDTSATFIDEEDKKKDLLNAWNDFKIKVRFPRQSSVVEVSG